MSGTPCMPIPCPCLQSWLRLALRAQVRLLNIGELRRDRIGALTFGARIPPYKDGALPSAPALRHAFPTAPPWQVRPRDKPHGCLCRLPLVSAQRRALHTPPAWQVCQTKPAKCLTTEPSCPCCATCTPAVQHAFRTGKDLFC